MASLRVRNGNYEIVFARRIDGKLVKKIFALGTRRIDRATNLCRRYTDEAREGVIDPWDGTWSPSSQAKTDKVKAGVTLVEVGERFLASRTHVRERTLTEYRALLSRFVRQVGQSMPVARITAEDVSSFCAAPGLSNASQGTYLRFCRMLFGWMQTEGLVPVSVARGVRYPTRDEKTAEKIIVETDLRRLFAAYRDARVAACRAGRTPLPHGWLRPFVALGFYAGLRLSEMLALQWDDLHLGDGVLRVRRSKTGRQRAVSLQTPLLSILTAWHRLHGRPRRGLVFSKSIHGREAPLLHDYVSKSFKRYVRLADLGERVNVHGLRHSCATNLLRKGVSLHMVSEMLGHSDLATTSIYEHLDVYDMQRKMHELGL